MKIVNFKDGNFPVQWGENTAMCAADVMPETGETVVNICFDVSEKDIELIKAGSYINVMIVTKSIDTPGIFCYTTNEDGSPNTL